MSVTWRDATHADEPRILELWNEQDTRFEGTQVPVDRPILFCPVDQRDAVCYPYQPPVIRVRVAEEEGVIQGFKYLEVVPEMCLVTGSREVMRSIGRELTEDAHWLKQKNFRSGWGLIPKKFISAFAHFLKPYPHIRPWTSLTPVGVNFEELGD